MNRILKKVNLRKSKEAVSEIIANILVLAMTVTLFSGVFWFVASMPGPSENVYGDFSASLTFESDVYPQIAITHVSGVSLKDFRTHIYFMVDDTTYTRNITQSDVDIGDTWDLGETWRMNATSLGVTTTSRVEAMIVDYTVNSLIWSDILLGAEGKSAPVMMDRWVATEIGSVWTRTDSILQTDMIKIFAKAVDVDLDIVGVYADLTALNVTNDMGWGEGIVKLNDSNNDGIFATDMDVQVPVDNNTGTKAIWVRAVDSGGRTTGAVLIVTVLAYTTGPPSILYAAIEPSSSLYGSPFTVRAYVTDPNNNLNKSSIVISNDEGEAVLGLANTTHATPSVQTGVGTSDPQKLRSDDGEFITVPAGEKLGVTSWTLSEEMEGRMFRTAVLKVRYYTGELYNDSLGAKINVSDTTRGLQILEWSSPIVRVFNIGAMGFNTSGSLVNLPFEFWNIGEGDVYFDYWWLEVTYSEVALSSVQRLQEDPFNPGYFTGVGLAAYSVSYSVAYGTYYYTVSAADYTGNDVQVRISHTVVTSETIYAGGYGRGNPPGNLNYSGLQGFNIFESVEWATKNYTATPRTEFLATQDAVVVVASKYLVNLETENTILVMDPTTKIVQAAVSSPTLVFDRYDYNSGYYVYNCTIDLAKLQNGKKYQVQVQLRDNWVPNNIFFATELISVGTVLYPTFKTYKDAAYTIPCDEFTTYDTSNNMIYVEVKNQYAGLWYQYGGDVEVRDFFWNAQIKRMPPASGWNGPVSTVTQVGSSNVYRFQVNLANATEGTPWIPGENSYALRYDMFKAGNETYVLSKIVSITAPKFKMDFVIGTTPSSGGSSWGQRWSMFFYKNDNLWSPPDRLEGVTEGKYPLYTVPFVRTADMNNDGKNDIVAVVGEYKSNPNNLDTYWLWLYINDGYWTRYTIADLGKTPIPTQMELGNVDFDNDVDVFMGFSNGVVRLYRNDGLWSPMNIDTSLTSSVTALKVGDLDFSTTPGNDPNRSLDVAVGRADGTVQIYKNADGAGASWTRYTRSGTSSDVVDFATSDIPVYGTVSGQPTGTYLDTRNSFYDPGVFERLYEDWVWRYEESTPSTKDPVKDTTGDVVAQLVPNDGEVYTVGYGTTAYIDGWDPSGLVDDVEIDSVVFKVRYETFNYDSTLANDFIMYGTGSGDPTNPMIEVNDSGGLGSWIEAEYDLTSAFDWASALITLKVSFSNTYFATPASSVNFDYWMLNVTWKTGEKLEHIWTIDVTTGSSHTFQLYASRSASPDADNFAFSYSADGVTYTAMAAATVSSTTATLYTATIPAGISGVVYIKVVDTNRAITAASLDYVNVFMMSVKTTAPGGAVGSTVRALAIADMNGDKSNDLVVIGETNNKGKVWVGLNDDGSILANLAQVLADNTNLDDCVGVGTGIFLGSNSLRDIAIAAGSKVYFVEQTTPSNYVLSSMTITASGTISSMATGDIDGNTRTDVLLATTGGQVLFYSNYLGTTSGWQTYLIDSVGCTINSLGLGRLQNA